MLNANNLLTKFFFFKLQLKFSSKNGFTVKQSKTNAFSSSQHAKPQLWVEWCLVVPLQNQDSNSKSICIFLFKLSSHNNQHLIPAIKCRHNSSRTAKNRPQSYLEHYPVVNQIFFFSFLFFTRQKPSLDRLSNQVIILLTSAWCYSMNWC